jgi:methylamine dehydrogenase accessory protein MauD
MVEALVVSNILLWIVVLVLLAIVAALSRQIGVLYERIAPMGALMMDAGPKPGDSAPVFDLTTLDAQPLRIGGPQRARTLLFFLSPTCPVCKKLLPILKSLQSAEAPGLAVVLASDGDDDHAGFRRAAAIESFPYVLSRDLGLAYRIGKLPYAVLIDARGLVRAKGLVNSREQLESLLEADERDVASVQDYIERQQTPIAVTPHDAPNFVRERG